MYCDAFGVVLTPSKTVLYRSFVSTTTTTTPRLSSNDDGNTAKNNAEDEAQKYQQQAEKIRQQIRDLESQLNRSASPRGGVNVGKDDNDNSEPGLPSLRSKRVMVVGANGRLGSMVCRYLLRQHPELSEVVAVVHRVAENSFTSRGYARLSYEVGAEDGIGTIGTAWNFEGATFQYDDTVMKDYNLNKLRIVECELLDPVQCQSVVQDVDAIIWCATDFNGNLPRSIASLDVAFLFRAVSRPTKGRVEIEGLENMAGAFKLALQEQRNRQENKNSSPKSSSINNFILISMVPEAYENFETPFGEFNAIKRQGERMLLENFPSLNSVVLQCGKFEDNFVPEDMDICMERSTAESNNDKEMKSPTATMKLRMINRRDAARAAVKALTEAQFNGQIVQVYTTKR
jgi:hypothetical protein